MTNNAASFRVVNAFSSSSRNPGILPRALVMYVTWRCSVVISRIRNTASVFMSCLIAAISLLSISVSSSGRASARGAGFRPDATGEETVSRTIPESSDR